MSETPSGAKDGTRRSIRLPIRLPIRIRGVAAGNEPFNESTWTLTVSEHGALIATVHRPAIGDIIEIENTVLNLTAKATVISVEGERFPREMAVELSEPQNIWGVQFAPTAAPADVREESGAMGSKHGTAEAEAQGAAAPGLGEASPPPSSSAQDKERGGPAGNQGASARGAGERDAQTSGGLPDKELQSWAKGEESLARLEANEKKAVSLEQHLNSLQDCVRASRAELDAMLSKFQELQLAWQSEVERAQGSIRSSIENRSRQVAQEFQQGFEEKAKATAGELTEAFRGQLEQAAASMIGNLTAQATETLSSLTPDYVSNTRAELARTLVQFKKKGADTVLSHLQRSAEEIQEFSLRQLRQHAEGSLEQLREELTAVGDALRDDLNHQAIRAVREALDGLSRKTQEAARDYVQHLDNRHQDIRRRSDRGASLDSTSLDFSLDPEPPPGRRGGR